MKPYEQSIATVTGFFVVLIGIALQKIPDNPKFGHDQWPCFLLSILLFLRFLLGSANHLRYVYLDHRNASRKNLIRDLTVLSMFGVIAIAICYSPGTAEYLIWTSVFLLLAFLWALYAGHRPWAFWRKINGAQAFLTLLVLAMYFGHIGEALKLPWLWSVPISALLPFYVVLLAWDFDEQLKVLQT